jgi:glycosyltransferase involved in cell wall biosynthesis
MNSRLLVVARRFWPVCEESCQRLHEWTSMLVTAGIEVTVLTARWHGSWPAESNFRDLRIVRLLPGPKSAWNETLFLRNVGAWVTKHRREFDRIYVDESAALLHQISHKHVVGDRPLIARFAGVVVETPNEMVSRQSVSLACDGCRQADVVVAANPPAHRQLTSCGIATGQIVRIPDIAWNPIHRSETNRRESLRALREINSDFALPKNSRLLVCLGYQGFDETSIALIDALIQLTEENSSLVVWFIGTNNGLRELYDRVKLAGAHHAILFHSPFDDVEAILQAADGLIFPRPTAGAEYFLPHALAAGIPFIAMEATSYRASIPEILISRLVKKPTTGGFVEALDGWRCDFSARLEEAEKARQAIVAGNLEQECRRAWLKVFS